MNQDLTDQQRKWLETYCDGTISPEEFARFEAEMEGSAEFRALARTYLSMDANLSQGAESILDLSDSWTANSSLKQKWKAAYLWSFGVVGIALFFAGLVLGGVRKPVTVITEAVDEPQHRGVAVLKHSVEASWHGANQPKDKEVLFPGNYQLLTGTAEIEFYTGTSLLLEAPLDLDLISPKEAFCRKGKLRAYVPPQARGFTILSPKFELVDLGTEFGVSVNENGTSNVQVFDGEVELYPPDGNRDVSRLKTLKVGSGLAWSDTGEAIEIPTTPDDYLSFQAYRKKKRNAEAAKFEQWKQWSESIAGDERLVAHFDFQGRGTRLKDHSKGQNHGAIIGAEWTRGRFTEKRALEFRRPGDRVRLEIPGKFKELTFSAWVRMDSGAGRTQALFLTDHYKTGHPHWQIAPSGALRLGFRTLSPESEPDHSTGVGYGSPEIFTPRGLGNWTFVCTTYSLESNTAAHYLNGTAIPTVAEYAKWIPLKADQKTTIGQKLEGRLPEFLSIGLAEIGNWGAPYRPQEASIAVRNFVGRIDSVTIWKKALSAGEIKEIYETTRY